MAKKTSTRSSQPTRTQLCKQLEAVQKELIEAQKLTALGELVSTTTHEFNNVLMTIMNYAKLGMRHEDKPTRDKALGKILAASERAAEITNAVLGMARNRSDELLPTDLQKIIEQSLVLLDREMSKYRIHIEKEFEEVPEALANGNQIQQVLLNLLINARQAMPEGGSIRLKLHHDATTGMAVMVVRDSGCGIPQEKLPQIFDRFYSSKDGPDESGKGGTGLGLSACRNIVESHQGRIRVESSVGKGTQFTIMLPIADKKPLAA